jgi:hypothetical protein
MRTDPHVACGSSLSKARISSAVSSSTIAHPSAAIIIHEEAGSGSRLGVWLRAAHVRLQKAECAPCSVVAA